MPNAKLQIINLGGDSSGCGGWDGRIANGHPYGGRIIRSVRNRSDRFPVNWVCARFPHPALRATFPPGEGFGAVIAPTRGCGRRAIGDRPYERGISP